MEGGADGNLVCRSCRRCELILITYSLEAKLSILLTIAMFPPEGGDAGGGLMSTLMMFALIIGIFYFLILRPQQKRQKERKQLLESVKKGDRIITASGLHATVSGLDEKTVLLQVADHIKMKFERSAVATILREGEVDKAAKSKTG